MQYESEAENLCCVLVASYVPRPYCIKFSTNKQPIYTQKFARFEELSTLQDNMSKSFKPFDCLCTNKFKNSSLHLREIIESISFVTVITTTLINTISLQAQYIGLILAQYWISNCQYRSKLVQY